MKTPMFNVVETLNLLSDKFKKEKERLIGIIYSKEHPTSKKDMELLNYLTTKYFYSFHSLSNREEIDFIVSLMCSLIHIGWSEDVIFDNPFSPDDYYTNNDDDYYEKVTLEDFYKFNNDCHELLDDLSFKYRGLRTLCEFYPPRKKETLETFIEKIKKYENCLSESFKISDTHNHVESRYLKFFDNEVRYIDEEREDIILDIQLDLEDALERIKTYKNKTP